MNKIILLILVLVMSLMTTSSHAHFFIGDDQQYQNQMEQLMSQVHVQQHDNSALAFIILLLGIGVVSALVIGAAIGSKARKASKGGGR